MPTDLSARSVAIFEPGCGTAVVCALNAHCLESEDVWPLPTEIRTPRSTGWGWRPGFPTIPRKDSGLVRSVSLALGSRSQYRRLCPPPHRMRSSCVVFPSPSLRKLRCVLHSDNARSPRLTQITSHKSTCRTLYRPSSKTFDSVKSPSASRESRLDCMARCAPSR